MSTRLDDIDSLMARMQSAFGVVASHVAWRYDRPVDHAELRAFGAELQRGMLGRVVAPAVLGAAGDRWSTDARFAPLEVTSEVLPAGQMESWLATQSRADIEAYGGPAWRLATVKTDDGGAVVSLLLSHAVADGLFLFQGIVDAVERRRIAVPASRNPGSTVVAALSDVAPAARQLVRAAKVQLASARRPKRAAAPEAIDVTPRSEATAEVEESFELPRLTALVPAAEWHAAAHARGGTSTVLAVAVAAEIAVALERTTKSGLTQIRVPVSIREGRDDQRANAIRGVAMNVAADHELPTDLRPLRAQLKKTLTEAVDPHAGMVALHRVVSRRKFAHIGENAVGTDFLGTTCTVVGKVDPAVLRIDGGEAGSMAASLINRAVETPKRLGSNGGCLAMSLIETGDTTALRLNAFHPPNPKSRAQLAETFAAILARYGLSPTFW